MLDEFAQLQTAKSPLIEREEGLEIEAVTVEEILQPQLNGLLK